MQSRVTTRSTPYLPHTTETFFTPSAPSNALEHLDQIFSQQLSSLKRSNNPYILQKFYLIRDILKFEIEQALWREKQPSGIKAIMENIPSSLSDEQRLNYLIEKLYRYPARPVITAHPTMVYTEDALRKIHSITEIVLLLNDTNCHTFKKHAYLQTLKSDIDYLIHHTIIPAINLTPAEEAKRALFIYQNMLKSYPEFLGSVTRYFVEIHGGHYEEVKLKLAPAVMASYKEIGSWVKGDTDGNPNITAKTKSQTVPEHQEAIITVYIQHLVDILKIISEDEYPLTYTSLHKLKEYFSRCINAIRNQIWFDAAGSEIKTKRIIATIQKLNSVESLPDEVIVKINNLSDLLQLAGLAGGLKEFVRQTTTVNDLVFDELITILAEHHPDVEKLLQLNSAEVYTQLSDENKLGIHKILSNSPEYFKTLSNHKYRFSNTTNTELERLAFILEHKDIFPYYIYSDTKSAVNFDEVRILTWLAVFMNEKLRMDTIHHHPFFNIPLCETPEDIKKIGGIVSKMLDNRYMRARIAESGYLSYVGGPSDLGKTGGMATHIDLVIAQLSIEDILEKYKLIYPELKQVVVRVLHGFGGDMKRRIGAGRQLHATHQGAAAYYTLGSPGAYYHFLHRVVGHPSEADLKVQELRQLICQHPEQYTQLLTFKESCIHAFQEHIQHPATGELLKQLTYIELERKMNTSSRAGSKASKKADPAKARAIGVLNHYLLSGVHSDIYMSLSGIETLSEADKNILPELFNALTVVKDIVYKTLHAIACCHFPRAWRKLGIRSDDERIPMWNKEYHDSSIPVKTPMQTLAHWQAQAIHVLYLITWFSSPDKAQHAQTFLLHTLKEKNGSFHMIDISDLVIHVMKIMGDDFFPLAGEIKSALVSYRNLAECLEIYHDNPASLECEENAILACRGMRSVTEGVPLIAELKSPLGLDNNLRESVAAVSRMRARL